MLTVEKEEHEKAITWSDWERKTKSKDKQAFNSVVYENITFAKSIFIRLFKCICINIYYTMY